jgi:hypothetical protein
MNETKIILRFSVRSLHTNIECGFVEEFDTIRSAINTSKLYKKFIDNQKREEREGIFYIELSDEEEKYWENEYEGNVPYCFWYLEEIVKVKEINTDKRRLNDERVIKTF